MYFSLNCLLLGEEFNNSFSVNIGATSENYDDIEVSHIKSLVFDRKSYKLKSLNINNSDSLELWKVDSKKVENNENKLEGFSTKDDIKNYLGGEYMESRHFISRYFIKKKVIDREAIHIIVQVPATNITQKFIIEPLSINELMGKILKYVIKSSDKTPDFSSSMPLKERNMESAIKSISNNFEQSFFTEESVAKSTLEFLVCCGAPGKTRYGVELFNHLKNNPEDILKDTSSQSVSDTDFLSIYLDFGRSVKLDKFDRNLTVDSIIALRIAFKFFVDESYQMDFNDFILRIVSGIHPVSSSSLHTAFVKEHKDLALALLKNCMKNNPVKRTEKVLKDDEKSLTYGELERDQYIILEDDNGELSVSMPVYFIVIYNDTLNLADIILSNTLKPNPGRNMVWQSWESFVTHFEMFKVNLLASEKTTAKFDEIYPGAFENDKTLSLEFKLRNLRGTAYLEHKFPIKYKDLSCKNTKKSYNWKEAIVFKNTASAEFGNSFVRYVSADDDSLDDDDSGTIDSDLLYSFRSTIPDDVVLVCRDSFHQHFGKLFASRYDFELLSVNANYSSPDTLLEGILGTAIKDSPRNLLLKRPFRSPKDFKDRVAFKDGVTFDN
ncbi:hypothetical protein RhiirA4_467091 [Rhizophagus irregularis]|uniref:Crinkler effector protein N-terminal domain-containing protein n=1 Tax=Rhizophagus irregularis TaxID=588596 RepID=A0A2I1GVB2_9GLOM|nr:hypothetical protein RhiirA4_467091 [Rhizophagus irregularis]